MVIVRLVNHRLDGDGDRSHGTNRAIRTKGTPAKEGEANWLNKFRAMANTRVC